MEARLASWNTSATFEEMQDITRDVALVSVVIKKRAFGKSDDSHLTMLHLYRGPFTSAAALERVLIRTLRPSGNRVGIGPPLLCPSLLQLLFVVGHSRGIECPHLC